MGNEIICGDDVNKEKEIWSMENKSSNNYGSTNKEDRLNTFSELNSRMKSIYKTKIDNFLTNYSFEKATGVPIQYQQHQTSTSHPKELIHRKSNNFIEYNNYNNEVNSDNQTNYNNRDYNKKRSKLSKILRPGRDFHNKKESSLNFNNYSVLKSSKIKKVFDLDDYLNYGYDNSQHSKIILQAKLNSISDSKNNKNTFDGLKAKSSNQNTISKLDNFDYLNYNNGENGVNKHLNINLKKKEPNISKMINNNKDNVNDGYNNRNDDIANHELNSDSVLIPNIIDNNYIVNEDIEKTKKGRNDLTNNKDDNFFNTLKSYHSNLDAKGVTQSKLLYPKSNLVKINNKPLINKIGKISHIDDKNNKLQKIELINSLIKDINEGYTSITRKEKKDNKILIEHYDGNEASIMKLKDKTSTDRNFKSLKNRQNNKQVNLSSLEKTKNSNTYNLKQIKENELLIKSLNNNFSPNDFQEDQTRILIEKLNDLTEALKVQYYINKEKNICHLHNTAMHNSCCSCKCSFHSHSNNVIPIYPYNLYNHSIEKQENDNIVYYGYNDSINDKDNRKSINTNTGNISSRSNKNEKQVMFKSEEKIDTVIKEELRKKSSIKEEDALLQEINNFNIEIKSKPAKVNSHSKGKSSEAYLQHFDYEEVSVKKKYNQKILNDFKKQTIQSRQSLKQATTNKNKNNGKNVNINKDNKNILKQKNDYLSNEDKLNKEYEDFEMYLPYNGLAISKQNQCDRNNRNFLNDINNTNNLNNMNNQNLDNLNNIEHTKTINFTSQTPLNQIYISNTANTDRSKSNFKKRSINVSPVAYRRDENDEFLTLEHDEKRLYEENLLNKQNNRYGNNNINALNKHKLELFNKKITENNRNKANISIKNNNAYRNSPIRQQIEYQKKMDYGDFKLNQLANNGKNKKNKLHMNKQNDLYSYSNNQAILPNNIQDNAILLKESLNKINKETKKRNKTNTQGVYGSPNYSIPRLGSSYNLKDCSVINMNSGDIVISEDNIIDLLSFSEMRRELGEVTNKINLIENIEKKTSNKDNKYIKDKILSKKRLSEEKEYYNKQTNQFEDESKLKPMNEIIKVFDMDKHQQEMNELKKKSNSNTNINNKHRINTEPLTQITDNTSSPFYFNPIIPPKLSITETDKFKKDSLVDLIKQEMDNFERNKEIQKIEIIKNPTFRDDEDNNKEDPKNNYVNENNNEYKEASAINESNHMIYEQNGIDNVELLLNIPHSDSKIHNSFIHQNYISLTYDRVMNLKDKSAVIYDSVLDKINFFKSAFKCVTRYFQLSLLELRYFNSLYSSSVWNNKPLHRIPLKNICDIRVSPESEMIVSKSHKKNLSVIIEIEIKFDNSKF